MKIVVFGLAVSSSWGNGHATLWRGLSAALAKLGHQVVFFEKDAPYYASTRDTDCLPGGELIIYSTWEDIHATAHKQVKEADVAMVTSYCPDALVASELIFQSGVDVSCFYDLDSPITLDRLERHLPVSYIGSRGLQDFDLTLSYCGGAALLKLKHMLGARSVAPLYGSVDPNVHFPVDPDDEYRADLSYLGTWAQERQQRLEALLVEPAKLLPEKTFLIGGSMYDSSFPWRPNIFLKSHVPASDHPAFYCSSTLSLNVTRQAMAENGYCPSGRLFEAAACGATLLSDNWEGLDLFLSPGKEILIAGNTEEAIAALQMSPSELMKIGEAARERVLAEHTADVRAREFENIVNSFRTVQLQEAV